MCVCVCAYLGVCVCVWRAERKKSRFSAAEAVIVEKQLISHLDAAAAHPHMMKNRMLDLNVLDVHAGKKVHPSVS